MKTADCTACSARLGLVFVAFSVIVAPEVSAESDFISLDGFHSSMNASVKALIKPARSMNANAKALIA
jgi:hypothetical protein